MKQSICKSWLVLFLLVLYSGLTSLQAQEVHAVDPAMVGMSADRLERLSEALQGYVDNDQISGAVALVARNGRIVFHEAVGLSDVENNRPMKTDAMFRIASQSKAIISVGVMILQEEGKLVISDPVGKYMPEFLETTVAVPREDGGYDVVEAERMITIRDLLLHRSGVSYGNGPARDQWEEAGIQGWYFADRDEPIRETIRRLAALPFDEHPGKRFIYGYSTDILGALIEAASGMPLDEFLKARIFDPLGMVDTHFYVPESKVDRLAVVYSSKEEGGIERAPDPGHMVGQGAYVEGPRMSFSGGAGLISTSSDYGRFLQMMLNSGELNGRRVLSRKSVELMTVDHLGDEPLNDGVGFGLGYSVVEDLGLAGRLGSVGEFGWGGAYHSTYWVDPKEELVVVYFTQLIPARRIDDHNKLRALVYQAIVD